MKVSSKKKSSKRGGAPKLTAVQVRAMIAKVKRGRTYQDVGREYGVEGSAVAYHCKKVGVESRRATS